jgi:hypothetical protein
VEVTARERPTPNRRRLRGGALSMGKVLRVSVPQLGHALKTCSRYDIGKQQSASVFPFRQSFNCVQIEARSRSHQWIARCGP